MGTVLPGTLCAVWRVGKGLAAEDFTVHVVMVMWGFMSSDVGLTTVHVCKVCMIYLVETRGS